MSCSSAGATFTIVTAPGLSAFATATVTVSVACTVNAPAGSMTGGLNVGPGSSSVTVQLEPAGMPLWVTLWDPVTCTWYTFVGFVQVIVKWNTVDWWLAGAVFSIVT